MAAEPSPAILGRFPHSCQAHDDRGGFAAGGTGRVPDLAGESPLRESGLLPVFAPAALIDDDDVSGASWQSSANGSDHELLLCDLRLSDPNTESRLLAAMSQMPAVGTVFMGFHLIAELGRGAFGRVFLAEQRDLANRYVVLKVTADDPVEIQALAQLQHTNITPIYSAHRTSSLSAICMPFLGTTTLSDVLRHLRRQRSMPETVAGLVSTLVASRERLKRATDPGQHTVTIDREPENSADDPPTAEALAIPYRAGATPIFEALARFSYADGVLWLVKCLAEGLAHAHDRGILHRDLKPANILLTDEGQPMLVDFNLSEDTKLRGTVAAARIGGTLPYMAPEQLLGYQRHLVAGDERSDIYALGLILYELLTGRHPFEDRRQGTSDRVLDQMLLDRTRLPASVRKHNPSISRAIDSIVEHCLEPDPDRRYQSAHELQEDLHRYLENAPLRHAPDPSLSEQARRWTRRHPRFTTAFAVLAMSSIVMSVLGSMVAVRSHRVKRLGAAKEYRQFQDGCPAIQFQLAARIADREGMEPAIDRGRDLLECYHVLSDPQWQQRDELVLLSPESQQALRDDISEVLVLLAHAVRFDAEEASRSEERTARLREALTINEKAEACFPAALVPRAVWGQRALLYEALGNVDQQAKYLARSRATPIRSMTDLMLYSSHCIAQRNPSGALALLERAARSDTGGSWALFLKGYCHLRLEHFVEAAACFSGCIHLCPNASSLYYLRALAYRQQKHYRQACSDLDHAILLQADQPSFHFERATLRQLLEDYEGAAADLTVFMELHGQSQGPLRLRAKWRQLIGDFTGAQKDRALAERLGPRVAEDWRRQGWDKRSQDPEDALQDIERSLVLCPLSATALHAKAFVLAERLGRPEAAIETLDRLLQLFPDETAGWRMRGLLLAREGDRSAAHADATVALRQSKSARAYFQIAGIYAQTSRTHPEDAERACEYLAKALKGKYGETLLSSDRDLEPLRQTARFRELVQVASISRRKPGG